MRIVCALVASAWATQIIAGNLPGGANVTAGTASVTSSGPRSQQITQSSARAVIDWRSFSIGAGYSVTFSQPSSSSITLNRVVGDASGIARSDILGSLSANGQVFLVNPSGIYFGRGAVLDTGGLVASTLNITNDNFLSGSYVFSRQPGGRIGAEVVNEGTLRAAAGGYVVLAGDRVTNAPGGVIEARLGTVALASGERLTLDLQGDRLVGFTVNEATADRLGGVTNAGLIAADGGRVVLSAMAARDVAGMVVNNTGIVRAAGIEDRDGVIELVGNAGQVASSGTLMASGAHGGSVRIDAGSGTAVVSGVVQATGSTDKGGSFDLLGDRVGVEQRTLVDVSGAAGGGTIRIGGDSGGANSAIANAQRTYIGAGATLRADATAAGDGGKIVVWADDWTRFDGQASARGGAAGGDGGSIEISGKQSLVLTGTADTSAPRGRTGTLLLDPSTITITDGAAGSGASDVQLDAGVPASDPAGQVLAAEGGAVAFTISRGKIETLGATTNINLEATGQITVSDMAANRIDITGAGNSFTLRSTTSGGINFLGGASDEIRTNGGAISLRAEGSGTITNLAQLNTTGAAGTANANITVFSGDGGLTVGRSISAGSGTVTLQTGEATVANQPLAINAPINAATVRLLAGDSVTQTSAGVITATNLAVRYADLSQTDSALLDTANNVVTNLAATVTGTGTSPVEAANAFSFRNAAGTALNVTTVDGVAGISTSTGAVTLSADSLNISQPINAATGSMTLRQASGATPINLGTKTGGQLGLTQAELNQITGSILRIGDAANAGGITLSNSITAPAGWSTLSLKTAGSVVQSAGALNVPNVAVQASGTVNLSNGSTANGQFAVSSTGAVSYVYGSGAAGALTVTTVDGVTGATTTNNNLSLTAGGGLTLAGNVAAGNGTVTLTAASGGVNQSSGSLTAGALLLTGAGNFDLSQTGNDIGTLAAAITGTLSFTDANALAIGTVSGNSGIFTGNGGVTLRSNIIDIAQNIASGGGSVTLTSTGAATAIDVGGTGAVNFELSAAELNRVIASGGALQIGDNNHTGSITVSAPVAPAAVTGGISLVNRTGGIAINSTLVSGGGNAPISLVADGGAGVAGAITSSGGTSGVSGSALTTQSSGGTTLNGSGNAVSSLAAINAASGDITLVDAKAAFSVQNAANSAPNGNISISNTAGPLAVSGTGVNTAADGNISLASAGVMTLQQNVSAGGAGDVSLSAAGLTQAGGVINADVLNLTGSGAFSLANVASSSAAGTTTFTYNNANTLTANLALGSIDYREKDALTLGAITTGGGNLTVVAGGTATQNTSTSAVLTTNAGPLTLTQNVNAGAGVITLTANNSGAGGINQTGGAITGGTLLATSGGQASFNQAGNDVGTLAIAANGAVTYADATGFTVGSIVGSNGVVSGGGAISLSAGGTINLTADVNAGSGNVTLATTAGGINQTAGAITGTNLLVTGAGPMSLPQATNDVALLAADVTGGFTYTDANALTVGTIGATNGVRSTDKGNIAITAQAGTLTVNQPVLSGGPCAAAPCVADATRGNVGLVAFGPASDLAINAGAQVAGNEVRLSADRNLSYSAGAAQIEATTFVIGGQNDPFGVLTAANAFCGPAPTITEIIFPFSGATTISQNLTANRVTLRSLSTGSSIAFGSGFGVNAQSLLFDSLNGAATFTVNGANNDVTTVSARGPFLGSGGSINYADQNSFSVGTYPGSIFGAVAGVGQAGGIFAGSLGSATLTAGGVGGTILISQPITVSGNLALNAPSGASQTAPIQAGSLALTGGGVYTLTNGSNDVGTLAAQLTNSGGLTYRDSNALSIGTVSGLTGISAAGPGALTVDIATLSGNLTSTGALSVITAGDPVPNTAPAQLLLAARGDLSIIGSITVHGGSVGTGSGAQLSLSSAVGSVSQSGGTISVVDNGPSTPAGNAPHAALVDVRAGTQPLANGTAIGQCNGLFIADATGSCGRVSLGGTIAATSTHGSARVDVRGPAGVNAAGAISATGESGPRVILTGDLNNSSGDLVSSGDVTAAAVTLTQTAAADANALGSNVTAGVLLSGNNVTTNGAVTASSRYGINISAQNNSTLNANVSATSSDGISLSTGATSGTVQTTGSATITAAALGLQAARDKGIFNLRTNIASIQALGARAITIDNSAHTGILTATVLGRISAATTDPVSGQSVPAVNAPVGALSVTTGGQLTIFSLDNRSTTPCDLTGNCGVANPFGSGFLGVQRTPLILRANSLTETPGAFNTASWSDITLRPFTASRTIDVRNFPVGTPDPNTTYYLASPIGLLNQFNPDAHLIIGGPGQTGDIVIGSQASPGFFPSSEQFSLANMQVTFQTTGRVFNSWNVNPDAPVNWVVNPFTGAPFDASSFVLCVAGQACLKNITTAEIIIQDGFSAGPSVPRNIFVTGTGTGIGGFTPPAGGGSSSGGSGGSGGGGSGSGGSGSGGTGTPPPGNPGGGGDSGTPGATITTTTAPPSTSSNPDPGSGGGPTTATPGGTDTTPGTVATGPDGGTTTGFVPGDTDPVTGGTDLAGTDPTGDGPTTDLTGGPGPETPPTTTTLAGTPGDPGPDDPGTGLTPGGPTDGTGTTLTPGGPPDGTDTTLTGGPTDGTGTPLTPGGPPDGTGTTLAGGPTDGTGTPSTPGGPTDGSTDLVASGPGGPGGVTGPGGPGDGGTGSGFSSGDGTDSGTAGGVPGGSDLASGGTGSGSTGDTAGTGLSGTGSVGDAGGTTGGAGDGSLAGAATGGVSGSAGASGGAGLSGSDGVGNTAGASGEGAGADSLAGAGAGGAAGDAGEAGSAGSGITAGGSNVDETGATGGAKLAGTGSADGSPAGAAGDSVGATAGESGSVDQGPLALVGGGTGDVTAAGDSRRVLADDSAPRCASDDQAVRVLAGGGAQQPIALRGNAVQINHDSRGCAGGPPAQARTRSGAK
jgi:filamentous hemagglutinin family protein